MNRPDTVASPIRTNEVLPDRRTASWNMRHDVWRKNSIQGPMWNPGVKNTLHVLVYAYLHRLLICIDSIRIHIAHGFFFKSIRYIYSTRIRCKLIWIASRLHSRLHSLSRLFSKSVFPCFRTDQIKIWDQVTMRLLERFSLTKFRWAQLFVGATLYGEDFGHGTIATRGCIPSWTDPRRTTTTIKSSFRPSRTT